MNPYTGPQDSDEAYEWAQRARDRRLEKLERQRTNGDYDWDPDEDDETYQDDEDEVLL